MQADLADRLAVDLRAQFAAGIADAGLVGFIIEDEVDIGQPGIARQAVVGPTRAANVYNLAAGDEDLRASTGTGGRVQDDCHIN